MKIPRHEYESLVRDSEKLRSVESLILSGHLWIPDETKGPLLAILGRVPASKAEQIRLCPTEPFSEKNVCDVAHEGGNGKTV